MPADLQQDQSPSRRTPSRWRRLLRWKVVVPSAVLVLLILSPLLYRQWRLSRVPEIADPFPVSEVLQPIPEGENAFPLVEEAFALRKEVAEADRDEYRQEGDEPWDPAHRQSNKYLELNRPALEKWRAATERDDYQFVPMTRFAQSFYTTNVTAGRDLVRWCQLEIERLTKTGRPAEAIPWLRASFRFSSLVTRNATWVDRVVGSAYLSMSARSAEAWMEDPDVTAEELQSLIAILVESDRLLAKPSDMVKAEYIMTRREYTDWSYDEMVRQYEGFLEPPVGSRWEAWIAAEPEFSRRLTAHVAANHLRFIDLPRRERPPLIEDALFDDSAAGEPPTGALAARELIQRLKWSKLLGGRARLAGTLDSIDRRQAGSACLQVALAAQAYCRDHGEFPGQLRDLQPAYLKFIPDDPYAARPAPVIYRRTGDGAVVYSRYDNGTDDGGTIVTYEEAAGWDLPDFGFRISVPGAALSAPEPGS